MRTIAIINQKGGCGKTTCSINLAAVMASRGHRTLLVDMDPQSHCALGLAVPEGQLDYHIADLMRSGFDGSVQFSNVIWQISRNFDLLPSTMALAGLEAELNNAADKDRRLMQVLSLASSDYDYCIIDCPPSIGLLTFNAMRASDEVIVPVETGYFAMQGSVKQEATIEMLARRAGHHLRFSVLATMYDVRTKLAREILSELKRQFNGKLLPVVINFNSKLKEAASFGQPITEYDPGSRGMQDFEKLATWLTANPPPTVAAANQESAEANPALSRAAELVERARALSARTATLSGNIATDPDLTAEGLHTVVKQKSSQPRANLSDKLQRVYGVRRTEQGLLFVQPLPDANKVSIAGDFNDWSSTATPMLPNDELGVWQACIQVPPGRYRYRLVVDGQWVQDKYNTYVESNPCGELNNVIEVEVSANA